MNQNTKLRLSGAGRNPARINAREADKTLMQARSCGGYFLNWIPACAGMTG
jgi:hypothetical protein